MEKIMTHREKILVWLNENPGYYSPTEIGMNALHLPYNSASAGTSLILKDLYRLGKIYLHETQIRYSFKEKK